MKVRLQKASAGVVVFALLRGLGFERDFGFKVWSSPVRDSEALVHLAHVENLAVETLRYLPRLGQVVDG